MQDIVILWAQQLIWIVTMFFEYGITLSFFMERRKWRIKEWFMAIATLSVLYSIVIGVLGVSYINEEINNEISIVLMMFLLNAYLVGGVRKRLLAWSTAWAVAGVTESIVAVGLIKMGVGEWTVNYVFDTIFSWVIIPIFYLILNVIIVKLFKRTSLYYKDKQQYENMSYMYLVPIMALMGSIYFFCTIVASAIAFGDYKALESNEMTFLLAYFIICDVILILLMLYINKNRHKRYIEQVELQYRNRSVSFYNRMGQLDVDTRREQDAISKQLQLIKRLSENRDMNRLVSELDRMEKALSYEDGEPIITGNTIVDAILNEKYQEACKANIRMITRLSIPEHIKMDIVDLCTIISGTVDTAIKACTAVKDEPCIKIECLWIKGYILLKVEFSHCFNEVEMMALKNISFDEISNPFSQPIKEVVRCIVLSNGLFEVNIEEKVCKIEITINCL